MVTRENPYLPHLIQKYTEDDEWSYMVIEYFPRGSLFDHFYTHHRPMSLQTIFGIAWRLVKCAQLMHSAGGYGWLHLDIKPENIMMSDNPEQCICLVDFDITETLGYARLVPRKKWEGSFTYMGTHAWDIANRARRDDMESIGLTWAWMLLGGSLPWCGEKPENIKRHVQGETFTADLAALCGVPVLQTYLDMVRALEVDEAPNYEALLSLFADFTDVTHL